MNAPDIAPGCQACATAAGNPLSGRYTAGCTACGARHVANSMPFAVAAASMRFTPEYRARLAAIAYNGETVEKTHARVKAWDRAIGQYRKCGGGEEGVLL